MAVQFVIPQQVYTNRFKHLKASAPEILPVIDKPKKKRTK